MNPFSKQQTSFFQDNEKDFELKTSILYLDKTYEVDNLWKYIKLKFFTRKTNKIMKNLKLFFNPATK